MFQNERETEKTIHTKGLKKPMKKHGRNLGKQNSQEPTPATQIFDNVPNEAFCFPGCLPFGYYFQFEQLPTFSTDEDASFFMGEKCFKLVDRASC